MSHGKVSGAYYGMGSVKQRTIEWETPFDVFDKLDKEFSFNLDPCATEKNAKCKKYFTIKDDGLSKDWKGRVFVNPPYGRNIGDWIEKAFSEVKKGNAKIVVCLIPVRTDNWWFAKYGKFAELRFVRHRIHFGRDGVFSVGPFGSVIMIFREGWKKHGTFLADWDWKKL